MNAKQATFVREYLVDLNGKQAAIRAGYKPDHAEVQASKLLRVPKVRAAVDAGIAARAARVEVKADGVLRDVERLSLKAEAAGEYSAALKGRELLGKHLGLWVDKVEHSGSIARPLAGKTADQILAALKGKS